MEELMRNVIIGDLLDIYGDLLTERQRRLLDMHYNQDWSLGEIAQQENISRQAVHDALGRGEKSLHELENTLHMLRILQTIRDTVPNIMQSVQRWHLDGREKEEKNAVLKSMGKLLEIEGEEGIHGI